MAAVRRDGHFHRAGGGGDAAAGRTVFLSPLRQPAHSPDPGRVDRTKPGANRRLCAGSGSPPRWRHHSRRRNSSRGPPGSRRPVDADPARARSCRRRRSAAAASGRPPRECARLFWLCRDRRQIDAYHPGNAKGYAGRIPYPRFPRRRDCRPRRSRPIARPYRGSDHGAEGTVPRGLANSKARQAAAADLLDQPRRRRARILGDAGDRQQPRGRRHLHIENSEQHLRPSLSGTRQVHFGGVSRHSLDHRHRSGFLPNHHAPDARVGRTRRAHQPR